MGKSQVKVMAERLPLAQVLRIVLASDRTLLSRREDLFSAMEHWVTPDLMRDYRSFQTAIQGSTVGELLLTADNASAEKREEVRGQAVEILRGSGMQERAAHRVVDTIVQGLGWPDRPAVQPKFASPPQVSGQPQFAAQPQVSSQSQPAGQPQFAAQPQPVEQGQAVGQMPAAVGPSEVLDDASGQAADAVIEVPATEVSLAPEAIPVPEVIPSDGQTTAVVPSASQVPAAPAPAAKQTWVCRCGHAGNKGNFCVHCGASRAEGEVDPSSFWTCICGHQGNKGNFCVHCGRSRSEGEADPFSFWTCICGHQGNKGDFCVQCGRSRQEGEQLPGRPSLVWNCRCGHHGNKGNFCTGCGASRAEGEVETWTCVCGCENTGNFCVRCGRPRNH